MIKQIFFWYVVIGILVGISFVFVGYYYRLKRKFKIRHLRIMNADIGKQWVIWVGALIMAIPFINICILFIYVIKPWWSERKTTVV